MRPCDVTILGGGLAGLTLALQLRRQSADLTIGVLERRTHPVPEAAFKVGESSVEIAANYFSEQLGLREHLDRQHLRKFGFRFFFSDARREIDAVTELGQSIPLAIPTWQIDRGIFENHLAEQVQAAGVEFIDGAKVRSVELSANGSLHQVSFDQGGGQHTLQTRWVIDASGRAGLLKRQLKLHRANGHNVNAVWFRVARHIKVDRWSTDEQWQSRCDPPARWLSTNHLCGAGYWVWLIPLSSGSHSIGIVADPKLHPLSDYDTYEKALHWIEAHQPRLAQALREVAGPPQDFMVCRRFSYDCARLYSGARWALTGEAGVFLDPFYSPGGDFIAISNTYIADLIDRDLRGESVAMYAPLYEKLYRSFYDSTLSLFVDQYPIFGDAEIMPIKVLWDYTYYWGVLCQLFYQRRLTDLALLGELRVELLAAMDLNRAVQSLLLAWCQANRPSNAARLLDQARLKWFAELNRSLGDHLDAPALKLRLRQNLQLLAQLAGEIAVNAGPLSPAAAVAEVVRQAHRMGASQARADLLFPRAA